MLKYTEERIENTGRSVRETWESVSIDNLVEFQREMIMNQTKAIFKSQ